MCLRGFHINHLGPAVTQKGHNGSNILIRNINYKKLNRLLFFTINCFIDNLRFNPFIDLKRYFAFTREAKTMGILTLGGGVPRNYAQQVMPLLDILGQRLSEYNIADQLEIKKFMYGVRICPEPVSLGGLSGCTYSEGISWGKFASVEEGGAFAEIHSDYTAILPWMVKSLQERLS